MKRSKPTDAESALLRWRAFTKNEQNQRIIQHYMIVPSSAKDGHFNVVQCYPSTWNISSTIIPNMTRQQAEHRVSTVIERSDCEVV